ncbi:MAG: RICIN domain-containing protein [Selenomonadaceae bacterium]|nr:RICIN domain-containing protein [Selenomonadaceae bacterium]
MYSKIKCSSLMVMLLTALLAFIAPISGEVLAAYQKTADNTVPAYTDQNLRNRQGNERVDAGDVVTVFQETSNAYYVRYPTPRGTKDRWVPKNIFNGGSNNNVQAAHPNEGDYLILPESNNSFALDVKGGGQAAAGTPIWLYQKNGSDAQIFTVKRVNGDWYKLVHKRTGLVINVQNGNDSDRNQMWLYHDDGSDSCYWRFINAGNGSYIIQSKLGSNRVLDLNGNNAYNGAVVHLWSYHTNQAARWKLVQAVSASTKEGNGDVNGDGTVDQSDYQMLLNIYQNGGRPYIPNGDLTGDGVIDMVDVSWFKQAMNGLRSSPKMGPIAAVPTRPTQNQKQNVQRQAKQTVPAFTDSGLRSRTGNECVDAGDMVTVLQETSNAYLVRYPTSNGTKDRWVSKDIFIDPPPVPAKLQELINRWNNRTWQDHYYSPNGIQCKEFAAYVYHEVYGYSYSDVGSTGTQKYTLNSNRMVCRASQSSLNSSNVRALFQNAQPGDFIQMRRGHGGAHSAILVEKTNNGVTFFEANADGKNTIWTKTYSYDDLVARKYSQSHGNYQYNVAMSVYHAR